MDERDNINKFRKKTARKKLIWSLAVLLLIVLTIILVVINWGRIISPFKDAALDVGEGGFPVELPGSAGYTLDKLGDSFYLLTDTYIYTYNGEGALISNIQHGFQNPVSVSNDKRIIVYDKNGKEFNFYSRTGVEYTHTTEDSIVFAEIGNDQRCAVVTTSTRYSNCLYVFNGEGKQIFRWASPDYKIMQAEFSDKDDSIYVSALGSKGGDLLLYLIRFDLDNAESHIWQSYVGSDVSYSVECCNDGIYVVTSGGCMLFDKETGEQLASSAFGNTISMLPDYDKVRTVVFRDSASSGDMISVYGDSLEIPATLYVDKLTTVKEDNGRFYVLSGSELLTYNSKLEPTDSYELSDVYSDLIVINGYAYLLGYNVVERFAV